MGDYTNIHNFGQMLAEDVGVPNMGWWDGRSDYVYNVPAIHGLDYYDEYHNERYPTYGAYANYYERNRRVNGAYGTAYYGSCPWLKPDIYHPVDEDHFYYLEDMVAGGHLQNMFVHGLTFFQQQKPNIPQDLFDGSFVTNDPRSYYRIDILGNEYPYYNGTEKVDVIIQQMIPTRNSNKIQVSFATLGSYGAYHSQWKLRIPCTLPVFNDKIAQIDYVPPIITNPTDDPPVTTPPTDLPSTITFPYSNFGGDTRDTGPSPDIDVAVDPYFAPRTDPREVEEDFPLRGWFRRWRWY